VPAQVLTGTLVYDAEQGAKALAILDRLALEASDDLTVFGDYSVIPEDPDYPTELQGKPAVSLTFVHIGEPAQAEEELRPLREMQPALDLVAPMSLYEYMCSLDEFIVSSRQYYDAVELEGLSEKAVDVIARGVSAAAETGLHGEVIPFPWVYDRSRAVPNVLPFGRRGTVCVALGVYWDDPADDERAVAWANSVISDLRNEVGVLDQVFTNTANPRDPERDRRSYGEESWKRLTDLKAKYDPENVFHLNHNIPPA
jgi:FAD/FMN-containing dehydrogenase